MSWKKVQWPVFISAFVLALVFVTLAEAVGKTWLPSLENRPGIDFSDPILAFFPANDVSGFVFWMLYATCGIGFLLMARQPKLLVATIFAYGFMHWFRLGCIYCVPLNAPSDLIVLSDPIVNTVVYPGFFLRRDLFYSGHFASVFLLFIQSKKQHERFFFLLAALAVGLGVMIQHIHYSIDIIGAVPFCYISVWCAQKVTDRFFQYTEDRICVDYQYFKK